MFDWHQFQHDERSPAPAVNSRKRIRICGGLFLAVVLAIFARAVQLEVSYGAAYRNKASQPLEKEISVPGRRGRILARDGTVLAADRKILSLAVDYRWLEEPPDPQWLKRTARARLTPEERKNPGRVTEEQRRVLAERTAAQRRLAELAGMTPEEWKARAETIQNRVERIAERVNRSAQAEAVTPTGQDHGWQGWIQELSEPPPPPRIIIAEQRDCHVMVELADPPLVSAVREHPEQFPGAEIITQLRRVYPQKTLAANLLGHLGPATGEEAGFKDQDSPQDVYHPEDLLGRMGLEKQYESVLRPRRGVRVEISERGGRLLSAYYRHPPRDGRDLRLTLDARVQKTAEELLDEPHSFSSGAIVVMDPRTGALLAAASAPRFDPNLFVGENPAAAAVLNDPRRPLFDRVARMAVAPGSVFKIVTATALLESKTVDPEEPFFCNGYLDRPDRQRCDIFVRQGVGHGETTLADALCVSCNVYFFHHAPRLGCDRLLDWAERFGFGRPPDVDLPGQSAGIVPNPENIRRLERHDWTVGDTQALAVGQGSLTATPLQVAVLLAAVANGGKRVTPHLFPGLESEESATPVPGLHEETVARLREGLRRVVSDPAGTAHETVFMEDLAVSGKTGTAETAAGQPHAWFAGYAPADDPKVVIVIALEHGGEGGSAAGPMAKRLLLRLRKYGILE
ncbi:MAG: hypothetical protein JXB10_14265 [Pirellulales bacterium]|nr:hypothetical protein [Pirellulales bacterium]